MTAGLRCPHCECCTALRCQRAILRSTSCDTEGGVQDLPLGSCPCWRSGSAARAAAAQVGRAPAGDVPAASPPRRRPPVKDLRALLREESAAAAAGHALAYESVTGPVFGEPLMVAVCGCGRYRSTLTVRRWARKTWGDHVRSTLRADQQRAVAS